MLDLFKGILEVAKSLLGLSDQLKVASQARKLAMADLFEKISACLTVVSSEIRLGHVPHGRCSELETYAADLPDKIREEVGDSKATELGATLQSAYNVEGLAIDLEAVADKEPFLREIEEAAGKFRALANMLRVG